MIYVRVVDGVVVNRVQFGDEIPADWPDRDAYVASNEAQIGWSYDGLTFSPPAPQPVTPTSLDIDRERERRIALGVTVSLSTGKSFTVQTRDERDWRNVNGLGTAGLALQVAGDTTTLTPFRDAANVEQQLTPAELVEMGLKVMQHAKAIYTASWALKAMSPIPSDYADDSYWP